MAQDTSNHSQSRMDDTQDQDQQTHNEHVRSDSNISFDQAAASMLRVNTYDDKID